MTEEENSPLHTALILAQYPEEAGISIAIAKKKGKKKKKEEQQRY